MKRIIALLLVLVMLVSGCSFSKTVVISEDELTDINASADDFEVVSARSADIKGDILGFNAYSDIITLEGSGYNTRIMLYDAKTLESRKLIDVPYVTEAGLANHGKNLVYRSNSQEKICLYSYDFTDGSLTMAYEKESQYFLSELSASVAIDTISDIYLIDGVYYRSTYYFDEKKSVYQLFDNDNLEYAFEHNEGRVYAEGYYRYSEDIGVVKFKVFFGDFVLLTDESTSYPYVVSYHSSSLIPMLTDKGTYYTDDNNKLKYFDYDGNTMEIDDQVSIFACSALSDSMVYCRLEGNSKMVYYLQNQKTPALMDIRTDVKNMWMSVEGDYVLIDTGENGANSSGLILYETAN